MKPIRKQPRPIKATWMALRYKIEGGKVFALYGENNRNVSGYQYARKVAAPSHDSCEGCIFANCTDCTEVHCTDTGYIWVTRDEYFEQLPQAKKKPQRKRVDEYTAEELADTNNRVAPMTK